MRTLEGEPYAWQRRTKKLPNGSQDALVVLLEKRSSDLHLASLASLASAKLELNTLKWLLF